MIKGNGFKTSVVQLPPENDMRASVIDVTRHLVEEPVEEVHCENTFFVEHAEVYELVKNLCAFAEVGDFDEDGLGTVYHDAISSTLQQYQEQSHLLDRHLETLVVPLMDTVKRIMVKREQTLDAERLASGEAITSFPLQLCRNEKLHLVFKTVYILCKVRGYKTVVKLFPHEVVDLEPALRLLQAHDPMDYSTWESRYVLLLWLSMLALIPFDLRTVDSSLHQESAGNSKSNLIETIVSTCKSYLSDAGPTREAAGICLAKLLTRPDLNSEHLGQFLEWSTLTLEEISDRREGRDQVEAKPSDIFLVTGIFKALVEIFKNGHRDNLLIHIPPIFSRVLRVSQRDGHTSALERKLTIKLVQRVGLTFLPPRIVSWRYQRGQRSLLENLKQTSATKSDGQENDKASNNLQEEKPEKDDDLDDDHVEVPDEIEEVIEQLLGGLRDKDTIVRWSAAKGIGRITSRLPRALADDVVAFVLELFDTSEGDSAWHGGCLALAELARRGLLLPSRLETVVPFVTRALVFDKRRGQTSVGAHVRDAACYVCWAFARAYAPSVMAPYVQQLSQQMLVAAVFDREVNCRRAASAAFQENVGRQGHENFPHGIDILTRADYFTLGIRQNAFLDISVFIASLHEPYRMSLLEHVLEVKLYHWDLQLRILSAKALSNLTPLAPDFMAKDALQRLLPRTLSPNMLIRHGATMAVAEIILALSKVPYTLDDQTLTSVRNAIMKIEKARLYRGRGGEWMRVATMELVENMGKAGHPLSERAQWRLVDSIDESLKHPKDDVKNQAVSALGSLTLEYFDNKPEGHDENTPQGADALGGGRYPRHAFPQAEPCTLSEKVIERLVEKYCTGLRSDPNPAVRRGYALALGVLPGKILGANPQTLEKVLRALCSATKIEDDLEMRDAETRRNAAYSLGKLATAVGFTPFNNDDQIVKCKQLNEAQVETIFQCLLECCDDYEADNRGDVGSWVRCAAMETMCVVVDMVRRYRGIVIEAQALGTTFDQVEVGENMGIAKVKRWFAQDEVAWIQFEKGSRGYEIHGHNEGFAKIRRDQVRRFVCRPPRLEKKNGETEFELAGASDRERALYHDAETLATQSVLPQEPVPGNLLGKHVPSRYGKILSEALCHKIVCAMIKQLCEKMDTVRDCAGKCLEQILGDADDESKGVPLTIPRLRELEQIFHVGGDEHGPKEKAPTNWKAESETFPKVVRLLGLPPYVAAAVNGIVQSVGALTESVSKNAGAAVMDWFAEQKRGHVLANLNGFATCLLNLLRENQSRDRVIIPALKTVEMALTSNVFDYMNEVKHFDGKASWLLEIHDAVLAEMKGSKNIAKLLVIARVFAALALFERPIRTVALGSILLMLGHRYPKIRSATSESFYLRCIGLGRDAICTTSARNNDDEGVDTTREDLQLVEMKVNYDPVVAFENVLCIVSQTEWDNIPTDEARAARDELYPLLRVHKPERKNAAPNTEKRRGDEVPSHGNPSKGDQDSYASLIKSIEMGY